MIGSLNGKLIEKNPTELLIECSGVGYEVKISLNTYTQLSDSEQIKLHTKLIVREDAQILVHPPGLILKKWQKQLKFYMKNILL